VTRVFPAEETEAPHLYSIQRGEAVHATPYSPGAVFSTRKDALNNALSLVNKYIASNEASGKALKTIKDALLGEIKKEAPK